MDFAQADALNSAIRALALRHRARAAELLAEFGLHPGQEYVLLELSAHGPQIQAVLAEALDCEPPSVTLMVRKLETAGYVTRRPSPDDRRATIVDLTPEGRAVIESLRGPWQDLAEETVAGVTGMSIDQLAELIGHLADNVKRNHTATTRRR